MLFASSVQLHDFAVKNSYKTKGANSAVNQENRGLDDTTVPLANWMSALPTGRNAKHFGRIAPVFDAICPIFPFYVAFFTPLWYNTILEKYSLFTERRGSHGKIKEKT